MLFSAWFTWTLTQAVVAVVNRFFDSLNSLTPFVMPQVSIVWIGISFFGIYFSWLWAMLSAVDTAASSRRQTGHPPQASVGWAAAMAWFCPGSGQIYTADRRFGFLLFGAYLLAILIIIPAYQQLLQSLHDLAQSGQLPANDPFAVIRIVHELVTRVDYSFGKLSQQSVKGFAVAATMDALRRGPLQADTKWRRPSMAYAAALLGLGWLCPGSGQLLQGRSKIGWTFLAAYFGSKILIGGLLGADAITVEKADTLAWLSVIVQGAAMIEAPLAMRKAKMG
jgi:hypothetical protein